MAPKVMLVGGGSAGHIAPSVAVAEALMARQPGLELLFIAADRPGDRALLVELGLPHTLIEAQPFPYRPSVALLRAWQALRQARGHARRLIADFAPDAVFSTGGYVSAPVVPEAKAAGVPVVLHASDAMPGRANLALARYATVNTVAYQSSVVRYGSRPVVWTGQPVRDSIRTASRERGRDRLGIPAEATVVLVVGAAVGAESINQALLDCLPQVLTIPRVHIVHQTGAGHIERIRAATGGLKPATGAGYQCHPFLAEPGDALAAADLVVSRCGSGSMAEIAVVGVPCIAIPYPHAGGHQRLNALPLVDAGAAVLLEDKHLSGGTLGGWITRLLGDRERLTQMAQAARTLAKPEAADTVADLILARIPQRGT